MDKNCKNCLHMDISMDDNVEYCTKDGNNILNRVSCSEFKSLVVTTCSNCKHNWYDDFAGKMCNKGHVGVQNKCSDYRALLSIKQEYDKSDMNSFINITNQMRDIYEIKNKNYGDSVHKQYKKYGLTSICIRLEDKFNRLESINEQLKKGNDVNVDDERLRDTLVDLANYAILGVIELDKEINNNKPLVL